MSTTLECHPLVDGLLQGAVRTAACSKRHQPTEAEGKEGADAPDVNHTGVVHWLVTFRGQVTPQVLLTVLDATSALCQYRLGRIPGETGEVKVSQLALQQLLVNVSLKLQTFH